jgi:hypothetical protein
VSEGIQRQGLGGRPSILVARMAAAAVTALYLYIFARQGMEKVTFEIGALVLLLGAVGLAVVAAWYSARWGVIGLTASGLALAAFAALVAQHDQVSTALVLGVPYIMTAALLWYGTARLPKPQG